MITRDTSLYSGLFEKANELLGYKEDNPLYIKNIDTYFQNLGYIANKANGDITYFMLPIEEPLFEINANTRNITIPEEFKNGISVQGDEIAETIFFSIDRYFDTTDFYSEYIVPVVQWKYADEKDYHLSATTGKIVIEDENSKTGGTIKVVFGWPISSEVTERATNIQFGVRFYTIVNAAGELITNPLDYANGELEYSFSTLNAITKINPSLEIKLNSSDYDYINKNNLIWKRMRNSKPADLNLQAILPILEYYKPGEGSIVDLDGENYILEVKATYPSGTVSSRLGKQIYQIIRGEDELIDSGEVISVLDDTINEPFGITYFKSKDTERNSTDIYYIKEIVDGNPVYNKYDESDLSGKELYERAFTYPINKAGKYYVKIINHLSDNNEASIKTGIFEILLPKEPIITGIEEQYHKIMETENSTVELELNTNNLEDNVRYYWYYAENDNEETELEILSDTVDEDNKYEANKVGYYYLKVVNNRNNEDAEAMSEAIRVTLPATAPESFSYRIGNYEVNITEENNIISPQMILTVVPQAERVDSYLYKWYKADNPTVIIGDKAFISPNYPDGTKIYCEVASVYNNNISDYTKTLEFIIKS